MLPIRQPMLYPGFQNMVPQMQRSGGMPAPSLPPIPQMKQPEDMSLQRGLGLLSMGMKNQDGPLSGIFGQKQWQPQNQAADLIAGGQYPDPLMRQAAQWNVPMGGILGMLGFNR